MFSRAIAFLLLLLFTPVFSFAETVSYEFEINTKQLNITGTVVEALAINDQVPAPTIRAAIGDVLRATFHNNLDVSTSIHWHGILLPGEQDGVPYVNTLPIAPGASHTFEFPILHDGTFWYHSHTDLQIQKGLYGAIVLNDNRMDTALQEEVVVFSDWTDDRVDSVLNNLKADDDFYSFQKDTVQSWDKVISNGRDSISNRLTSSFTRIGPMDLADVGYDAFLANGQRESTVDLLDANSEQIKLRMVNGSTSSYYDIEYAGGPMTIVAADGQDVEPIRVKRLRISTAETYDVLVSAESRRSFELRATSVDGTGYSSMFVGSGERISAPDIPPPNLFLMSHMDMDMDMDMSGSMDMQHEMPNQEPMAEPMINNQNDSHAQHQDVHTDHEQTASSQTMNMDMQDEPEVIAHMIDYEHLIATSSTALPVGQVWRDITLELTGNMEQYVWSFNGQTSREDPQILIRKGENVRFHLNNTTMMHHPLHLHGHFFRVVNQHGDRSPLKHTVNIPPMGQVVIEFDANEEEDWLFHCHNQYHMKTGMNRVVSYEETSLFTPQIDRLMQPSTRWFNLNEFHLMSSFMDYEFSLSDDRHALDLELDADLVDTYELHLTYNYSFNRFVSAFAGMESREHHHEDSHDIAIAGLNITLPMLIDSEWRFDDHGEFRLELESEISLTKHFGFDWRWNTEDEYRYGVNYKLNSRWAITVHKDTEYGNGVGLQFFY